MRFLVTAGNTREKIDSVRDWGNIFTGNTGLAIARAMADLGTVDLLTSNRTHIDELAAGSKTKHPIVASGFGSHAELKGALAALLAREPYDAIFMSAAIADYAPVRTFAVLRRGLPDDDDLTQGRECWLVQDVQAAKIKSTHSAIAVLGHPTEKLVDLFRGEWKYKGLLFKFKLEAGISDEDLIRVGRMSRKNSGADFLIANTLEMVRGAEPCAILLSDAGEERITREKLAERLRQIVKDRLAP